MIDLDQISAHPLHWPTAWPRVKIHTNSKFRDHSISQAVTFLLAELARLRVSDHTVIISTNLSLRLDGLPYSNQPKVTDPGVAVYFPLRKIPTVLACDRWRSVEENIWAIAKHIEALRGQERWGVGNLEQAFRGYQMIEAHAGGRPWWKVLGLENVTDDTAVIRRAYKERARKCHPDRGGERADWDELELAFRQATEATA